MCLAGKQIHDGVEDGADGSRPWVRLGVKTMKEEKEEPDLSPDTESTRRAVSFLTGT